MKREKRKIRFLFRLALCAVGGIAMVAAGIAFGSMQAKASTTPFLTLDTFSGLPGSTVNVSGGNFTPGETVNIFLGSLSNPPAATSTARGDSLFGPVAIVIPANSVSGPLAIGAVGASSTLSANNSFYVQSLAPAITVTSTANTPESVIRVSGTGYAANESVQISLGSASATAMADASGTFPATSLTIPFVSAGTHAVTALGSASGASSTDYFYVAGFYPSATPSTYFGMPGDTVKFSGSGFAPNETVNVFEDANQSSSASIAADSTGSFNTAGSVTLPFGSTSTSTVFMLVGASSTASTSVAVGLGSLSPSLTPSSYYLERGNSFTVTAGGFAGGERVSVNAYGNAPETILVDASGTASAGPFTVPLSASSTMLITATGASSTATASTSITIGTLVAQQLSSSTLNVSLTVDNAAGGSAVPSDFTVNVSGASASPASFAGSASSTAVTVEGDTSFTVTATATSSAQYYVLSSSGTCAGQIPSASSDACALTETYVTPPLSIAIQPSSGLPDGTVGAAYSETLSASTTASGPFAWTVASGTLPAGITLDASSTASTTSLSGTPTAAGSFAFVIGVTAGSSTEQQSYGFTINAAASTSTPTTGSTGGGGAIVGGGSSGGGGVFYSVPSSSSNTNSTPASSAASGSAGTGMVLGASAVNPIALAGQVIALKQHVVALEFQVSGTCMAPLDRNLRKGMSGRDVRQLQTILNQSGFTQVAASGPGSPGNETTYFGPATARAVIGFQDLFAAQVLQPNGLVAGNGFVGPSTRAELTSLCAGTVGTS